MVGLESLHHEELSGLLAAAEVDLRRLGIGRRTRVMTALPDGPLAAVVLLALIHSAVCAPVNPDLRGAEWERLIPELGVEVLVAHGPCAAEARLRAAAAGLPVIEVDWEGPRAALRWSGPALPLTQMSTSGASPDDTALVLLTSGSSARPKRVPLTHRQLVLAARRMADSIALTPADCCLNLMPMFHVGAVVDLLLAPLASGGSLMRPEGMTAAAFFEALDSGRPTWFQGVPTLLHELAVHALRRRGSQAISPLRLVRSVSSPMPLEWISEIQSVLGAVVIEIYGMTETAGVITSNPLPPERAKMGSVGQATTLEIKVLGLDGNAAEPGTRGEILVRGPGVMSGYENMASRESGFTEDGWLQTGDEGFFDPEGFLFITGRIGDQINRGGEKIAPREIDEVLVAHPAVKDAAAFPMPHPHLGHDVAAAVVLEPGMEASAESLTAHVAAQLAYFKVPKAFYAVAELPRGPGGKLRRRLLPDQVRGMLPLASAAPGGAASAQTAMEQQVMGWWGEELGVPQLDREADFFELGGDSLAAASFTVKVEKALGVQVRPAALFDHPTVHAFASYLEQALARATGDPVRSDSMAAPAMHPDFLRRLLAAMSVWPGERRDESSLLMGLRLHAPGVPVFWCGQGRGEFDNMARALPENQPVYGMRSLYLFEGKKKEDEQALALLMAREIETLRQGREVILGGFCAGGRIAFEAARQLRSWGAPVKLVFIHEAWCTDPIDVPVALAFCEDYAGSPWRQFSRPEALMNKRFTGGWKLRLLQTEHNKIYAEEFLAREVQHLKTLWEDALAFTRPPAMEEVRSICYRARLSGRLYPRVTGAGWRGVARVTVTNLSGHPWLPGARSGLHLGHRWRDGTGRICGDPGPSVPLPREVRPGRSITLTIQLTAPSQAGRHWLEIDMVDEGLAWFSEKKSQKPSKPLRLGIRILDRYSLGLFGKRPARTLS